MRVYPQTLDSGLSPSHPVYLSTEIQTPKINAQYENLLPQEMQTFPKLHRISSNTL